MRMRFHGAILAAQNDTAYCAARRLAMRDPHDLFRLVRVRPGEAGHQSSCLNLAGAPVAVTFSMAG